MVNINFEKDIKTLFIEISGFIKNEEAVASYNQLQEILIKINGIFFIIVDISKVSNSSFMPKEILMEAMRLIDFFNPKALIRIVNNYSIAIYFDAIYMKSQSNYKIYRVASKEIAMEIIKSGTQELANQL